MTKPYPSLWRNRASRRLIAATPVSRARSMASRFPGRVATSRPNQRGLEGLGGLEKRHGMELRLALHRVDLVAGGRAAPAHQRLVRGPRRGGDPGDPAHAPDARVAGVEAQARDEGAELGALHRRCCSRRGRARPSGSAGRTRAAGRSRRGSSPPPGRSAPARWPARCARRSATRRGSAAGCRRAPRRRATRGEARRDATGWAGRLRRPRLRSGSFRPGSSRRRARLNTTLFYFGARVRHQRSCAVPGRGYTVICACRPAYAVRGTLAASRGVNDDRGQPAHPGSGGRGGRRDASLRPGRPERSPGLRRLRHRRARAAGHLRGRGLPALVRRAARARPARAIPGRAGRGAAHSRRADPRLRPHAARHRSHAGAPGRGRDPRHARSGRHRQLPRGQPAQVGAPDQPVHHRHLRASPGAERPGAGAAVEGALPRGQLPVHAHRGGAERGHHPRGGREPHALRRARAERVHLHDPRHRGHALRHALRGGGRGGRAEGHAPRRRRRGGDAHAAGGRHARQRGPPSWTARWARSGGSWASGTASTPRATRARPS